MTALVGTPLLHTYSLPDGRLVACRGLSYAEHQGDSRGGALAAAGHATGATQWPAGRLLCDFLCSRGALAGCAACELGCGLGMCGLTAAALGASVVLTDGDAGCVAFAAANAQVSSGQVRAALLRWGDAAATAAVLADAAAGFQLVLGGDLVYEAGLPGFAAVRSLFGTVHALLAPGGVFLLGLQRRSVPLAHVLECGAEQGLCVEVPPGGWAEDLFGNRTEELSGTWQLCVLRFTRGGPAAARTAAAALLAGLEDED